MYSSITDDIKLVSEQLFVRMAVSVSCSSSSQNFDDSLCYTLSQLGLSDLQLKNDQKQAMFAIYGGKGVFVRLPTAFGKIICFQILPFLFDHKCGLVGGKKRNCAVIVSPLIALMVDQVRNLTKSIRAANKLRLVSYSSRHTTQTFSYTPFCAHLHAYLFS